MKLKSFLLANVTMVLIVSMLSDNRVKAETDPCGMVPPIYNGPGSPITRIGLQKTYVFHKNGLETFVIKPGFRGKVDNFGMLIPFPNPPAIRKVPDNIFDQIVNAVDPPEVTIYAPGVYRRGGFGGGGGMGGGGMGASRLMFAEVKKDEVKVLKEEAVGMYEVATLAAGSAESLKRWMDENGYKYPDGMDKVCEEYIEDKWCFVAVKTKVGNKKGANPKPGLRETDTDLPSGAIFDGHVQGMGFRFKSKKLVVPMRLSAFNSGDMRNVVYILSDSPKKIRHIPEEYVVRQVYGKQLHENLTEPLPLRVIGGTVDDLNERQKDQLPALRDPTPKNGLAKELFLSDLVSLATKDLSLPHEEKEKELLKIGEYFQLRGPEIDQANQTAIKSVKEYDDARYLQRLKTMTLTVVDGDFPRKLLSEQNLTFSNYRIASSRNRASEYDAKLFGPGRTNNQGRLYEGKISFNTDHDPKHILRISSIAWPTIAPTVVIGMLFFNLTYLCRRRR